MQPIMSTFHSFPLLPPELRQDIYLLATPPRIVKIHEMPYGSWKSAFLESLHSDFSLQINPALSYFAHNWRRKWTTKPDGSFGLPPGAPPLRQTRLEAFGFSSSSTSPQQQPWISSKDIPDVDLVDLESYYPDFVWEACRNAQLFSRTPPPALLFVCRESRKTLIEFGYELAFGTWSAPPATWFCFRHDILFADQVEEDYLLDPSRSNLGQLDPKDLVKVKRVALNGKLSLPREWIPLSQALRLMPNVAELFLVALQMDDVPDSDWENLGISKDRISTAGIQVSSRGKTWDYLPCQDCEISSQMDLMFWPQWYDYELHYAYMIVPCMPPAHAYFTYLAEDKLPTVLESSRDFHVSCEGSVAWNIPRIHFVHLGSPEYLEFFIEVTNRRSDGDDERESVGWKDSII